MGADTFSTYIIVTGSLKEAFDEAVKRALYDYGHAGYTGTLAEKDSFVLIGKAESQTEAGALARKLINEGDPRIDDKWGPAGIITFPSRLLDGTEVTKALIFGWASS
jgi:hypothetical protein